MTRIQQVLFELEAPYMGHPYHVTGHALYNAIASRVDPTTRRELRVSNGVFVPGEHGSYPADHSQSGGGPYLGTSLPPVENYEDLFLFRDPAQRWLSDSRPRDAHNTFDIQMHGGRWAYAPTTRFGRPPDSRNTRRTVTWYVHCYLHAGEDVTGVVPVEESVLEGLRVGGGRNYGFGKLSVADMRVVDLDGLSYEHLETAREAGETFELELLSPYVLRSEYPDADDQSVPWWWATDDGLRRRETRLVVGEDVHSVGTVDHGQVVTYAGEDPVETAKNGILRVGTHSRYGFGEFRVRSTSDDRVPEFASGPMTALSGPAGTEGER